MDDLIAQLYRDTSVGLKSSQKLYEYLKTHGETDVTLQQVKDVINSLPEYQLTFKKKKIEYPSVVSWYPGSNIQFDIMYLPNPLNSRKYLFVIIDVYTRKVFFRVMTNRRKETIFKCFKDILEEEIYPKYGVVNANCDNEFATNLIKNYCEDNGIKLWFSDPDEDNKNAIVERVNRTIREILLRWQNANGQVNYYGSLDDIIENYNNTEHFTTEETPNDIWNNYPDVLSKQEFSYVKHDYQVGDFVRYAVKKSVFDKASSVNNYTKQVFMVSRLQGNRIYLENPKTRKELTTSFKPYQLMKTKPLSDPLDEEEEEPSTKTVSAQISEPVSTRTRGRSKT